MYIDALEFLNLIRQGVTEQELNQIEEPKTYEELASMGIKKSPATLKYLVKYQDHTIESAMEHLNTDYSDGFTICQVCGSYYHLGKGFTKHLSNGCLHCEGREKHNVYHNQGNKKLGFPARDMSTMFDDGMHYCKNELEIEKFKNEVKLL